MTRLDAPPSTPWPRRALLGIFALLVVRAATLSVLPLIDSTESRYAQVAADMAETGNWRTPQIRIHDQLVPFEGKPPLHFWIGALAVKVFGRGELAARLPSLLAAIATTILLLTLGKRVVGEASARAAALIFAIGPLAFLLAGTVVIDGTLTACTTGAILIGLAHDPATPRGVRRRRDALLGLFLGLGFLAKGPIALAVVGSAGIAVAIARRSLDPFRGHAWFTGGATLLAIAAPWFIAQELHSPGFLRYFFIQENLLRYTSSEIGDRYGNVHVFFRTVSLAWWAVAALPLFVTGGIAWRAARRRHTPGVWRGAPFVPIVAASIGIAVLLSPSRHILVTYLLPAAPIAALAAGHAWTRAGLKLDSLGTAAVVASILFAAGILAIEPKISADKSCRDAIALARDICHERERTEIVFPRKTPWSAYYYGGSRVVPMPADRYLFRALQVLADHPNAVFLFKRRELRRVERELPELRARFEFVGETGQWHLAVLR